MNAAAFTPLAPAPPIAAFPVLSIIDQAGIETGQGMELRDYFAAQVMAAIGHRFAFKHDDAWDGMALLAYAYADAMVRRRAR
jgi:hypothetical protein